MTTCAAATFIFLKKGGAQRLARHAASRVCRGRCAAGLSGESPFFGARRRRTPGYGGGDGRRATGAAMAEGRRLSEKRVFNETAVVGFDRVRDFYFYFVGTRGTVGARRARSSTSVCLLGVSRRSSRPSANTQSSSHSPTRYIVMAYIVMAKGPPARRQGI